MKDSSSQKGINPKQDYEGMLPASMIVTCEKEGRFSKLFGRLQLHTG